MAYVRDVMEKEFITAMADSSIQDISKMLAKNNISNIPVVGKGGELAGVVSEQDIIRAMGSGDLSVMTAGNIMTKQVISIKEDDCVEYASKIFIEHPFRRLPVTRNNRLVGVITREAIIKNFMTDYY
ncbi:MAG: CBS domain-containing protein [Candidatus Omnitrophota bacterium]